MNKKGNDNNNDFWSGVLKGPATLTDAEAGKMLKIVSKLREEKGFRIKKSQSRQAVGIF